MQNFGSWITGIQLIERWKCAPHSIIEAVGYGLPCYFERRGEMRLVSAEKIKLGYSAQGEKPLAWLFFKNDEILEFEEIHGNETGHLSPNDRRHLGLLKAERETIKDSIFATVKALIYCQKHFEKEKKGVTKTELLSYLDKKYPMLPVTSKEIIRACIPRKYKAQSGRPSKTAKT